MTTSKESESKRPLKLKRPGRLELNKTVESGQVRQSFSHGRSKSVTVEVKRKRTYTRGESGRMTEVKAAQEEAERAFAPRGDGAEEAPRRAEPVRHLTESERQARLRAVETARRDDEERRKVEAEAEARREADRQHREEVEARRRAEAEAAEQLRREEEERRRSKAETAEAERPTPEAAESEAAETVESEPREGEPQAPKEPERGAEAELQEELGGRLKKKGAAKPGPAKRPVSDRDRRRGKLTISQALEGEEGGRSRSLAAMRRQREREKQKQQQAHEPPGKVVREVVIPESITVQELANRMAERGAEVVKALMKMGTMATINQAIDADTAELLVGEFGHRAKRVSDADIEEGLHGEPDTAAELRPRAPVVTVMGHVDHGKTSLLDALRHTDVVSGEAGGITQHIGAYQVELSGGDRITFIDTPGHEAFTEMRSRGAHVTDLVVLVVAADDGIKDQTVEAINHANAAGAPIVVAINKCDKPEADPDRVRQELLQHELVVEEMGGDVLAVEVSAKEHSGLDKLEEAILLIAEMLELKANPDRNAEGVVVEAKLEKGRGPVATLLVKRGTLRVGDIFVVGSEWGRVRALVNDRGEQVKEAGPAVPVEVLGLQGTPKAGDEFVVVVEDESRAREIANFRRERKREREAASAGRGTLEQMLSRIKEGETKELPVVVKADVQGSLEAIVNAFEKLGNEEVAVRVLHAGVGGVNESDVTLAHASDAMIIGFNVRANAQAREAARRDGVDIRYYSVIYNVVDDVKAALQGMLAPTARERILGYAEVRQVFTITKVGKVAGCRVTEGMVRRGAHVRLLRDDVVVHEGTLKSLKRFKDEVKEVREGFECGMAFENYGDIHEGDRIECYEVEEVARAL